MKSDIIETTPGALATQSATPIDILRLAVERGADIVQLERLMALQERWEANEARKAFNVAFSSFKAESVRIIKNKITEAGPLTGRKYAELFAIVNAVTPALSQHGLSASWKITKDEKEWIEVTCTVQHVGGHSESVSMGGPPDNGGAKSMIQARASTVTYLERYTLKAITGLSEQNDDNDGAGGALGERIEAERKRAVARTVQNPSDDSPDWREPHRQALREASGMDALGVAWTAAQAAAKAQRNSAARAEFLDLKDARKAAIEQAAVTG